MAQSKKSLLKRINRRCTQAGRALAYAAYAAGDVALLDAYGQLRQDIRETMQHLRIPPSADLRDAVSPVTSQQIDQLRLRLIALQTRLITSSPLDTVL